MRRKDKERDAAFAWQVMAEALLAGFSKILAEKFRCPRRPGRRGSAFISTAP